MAQKRLAPPRRRPRETRDSTLLTYDPIQTRRAPPAIRRARATLVGLLLAAFGALTWVTVTQVNARLRAGLTEKLEVVLQANANSAREWIVARQRMAQALAASPSVARTTARLLTQEGLDVQGARQELAERLDGVRAAGAATDYFIVDARLRVLASSAPDALGLSIQPPPLRGPRQGGLSATVAPLGWHPLAPLGGRDGVLYVTAPIGSPDAPAGYLLLSVPPLPLAQRAQLSPWGKSGEAYAFNKSGVLLTESRYAERVRRLGLLGDHVPSTAHHLRLGDPGHPLEAPGDLRDPPDALPLTKLAASATQGASGSDVSGYRNYLGDEVVGAWTWLPEYGFGLGAEAHVDDALASIALVQRASMVLAALIAAALVAFTLLGRWTLRLKEQSQLVTQRLDRLARALQPLSAALEHDPGAVLLVNDRLEVVYANPAASRMLGTAEGLAGAQIGDVFARLAPEIREALVEAQDTVVSQREDDEDGETLLVSTRELTIDGKLHALYSLRPVTSELRRQEVEHWKKLIRVLSHELNNALAPITSLVSSARKLVQGSERAEQLDKIFSTIAERTEHLHSFLESYRSVARLPRPARRDVSWQTFLHGVGAQFPIELTNEVTQDGGYFDPVQLERALVNVIKNAQEAGGDPDDIELHAAREGDGVRLDVMDRGTGMSPQVLEHALLPFYSTKRTGTGVGLALTREIVEAHHGRIALANRDGGGLVVSIWIPNRAEHLLSTTL